MRRPPASRVRPRHTAGAGLVVAVAVVAGACTSPGGPETTDEPTATVSVFGPWRGTAADAFRESMEPFEQQTGIDVVYTGSGDFTVDATRRLEDGDPPDVVVFPQPGLMSDLAERGYLVPPRADVAGIARSSHRQGLAEAAAEATSEAGILYRLNVKSLVWYPPDVFTDRGYDVPETWAELETLAARIQAEGTAPWCLGVESFEASGWPATDWVEDIVLRSQPTDVYDAWVAGDIAFTDEEIAEAFTAFAEITLATGRSFGARRGILNTPVGSAQSPMFTDPAGCLLHRQASFQADNLGPGTTIGPDGDTDVFVLPPTSTGTGPPPLLIGGTFASAATDTPQTWSLMSFLASAEGSAGWVERGGFLSPHRDVGPQDYPNEFDARVAQLLADADIVRFDASDQMDPAVGSGTFFQAMLDYIATGRLEEALTLAQSGYAQ